MGRLATHYENLKISRSATPEVVRAAYKVLTQKYHPDKNPPEKRSECERIMRVLNEAYEVLSDPARKRAHDTWIEEQEEQADRERVVSARADGDNMDVEFDEPASEKSNTSGEDVDAADIDQETASQLWGEATRDLLNHRLNWSSKVSQKATWGQRGVIVYRLLLIAAFVAALAHAATAAMWIVGTSSVVLCLVYVVWRVREKFGDGSYDLTVFESGRKTANKLIKSAYYRGYNVLPDAGDWELEPAFMRGARIGSDIGPLSLKGKLLRFDIFPMYVAITFGRWWKTTTLISWDQVELSKYKRTRVLRRPISGLELQRVGYLYETKHQQPDLRYTDNPKRYFFTVYGVNLKLHEGLELEFEFGDRDDRSALFTIFRSFEAEFERSLFAEADILMGYTIPV